MNYVRPEIVVFDSQTLAEITARADSGIICIGQCAGVCNVARSGINLCSASCGANKSLKTGPCGCNSSTPTSCGCSSRSPVCKTNS